MAFNTDASWNLVVLRLENQKVAYATGTTIPVDTTSGYTKGCLFVDTDVATGTSGLYTNVWTDTSCVFKLVTNAA